MRIIQEAALATANNEILVVIGERRNLTRDLWHYAAIVVDGNKVLSNRLFSSLMDWEGAREYLQSNGYKLRIIEV